MGNSPSRILISVPLKTLIHTKARWNSMFVFLPDKSYSIRALATLISCTECCQAVGPHLPWLINFVSRNARYDFYLRVYIINLKALLFPCSSSQYRVWAENLDKCVVVTLVGYSTAYIETHMFPMNLLRNTCLWDVDLSGAMTKVSLGHDLNCRGPTFKYETNVTFQLYGV